MKIHYYVLCYRFEALVASHLEPEAFGRYMAVGTKKNTRGNVLFFEIDPPLGSPHFRMHDIAHRCVPHVDGSPKRSKYISIYRVLEHLDLSLFKHLYLCTADGRVMALEPAAYNEKEEGFGPNLYGELCPVSPLVVSALPPKAFLRFMTDPENAINVPKLLFVDMLLDRDEAGMLAGYLPYPDPLHIVDCLNDLERGGEKTSKTVARSPRHRGFFRTIRRGFFLGGSDGMLFFPFPERRELEVQHAQWWRSASESLIS
ncbi:MAG: hypothetical protein IPP94_01400 [Ignavibacteria bacterium]|nr:hypothetical protein [Ignavibacteria bacterium]